MVPDEKLVSEKRRVALMLTGDAKIDWAEKRQQPNGLCHMATLSQPETPRNSKNCFTLRTFYISE